MLKVSIHTRHRCRVMREQMKGYKGFNEFQSTPGIAAG